MRTFDGRFHGAVRLALTAGLLALAAGCAEKKALEAGTAPPSYSISGNVSGAVRAGVKVRVVGGSRSATTDTLGNYTIAGLSSGAYTLEATLAGYAFTPATRPVTVNAASVTGQDFTAQTGVAIAGQVTGDGGVGVTVTLMGPEPATSTRTTTTDDDGKYVFPVVAPGSYLVTPARAGGWTFSPANSRVAVATTSLTGPDFASITPTHGFSGTVTGPLAAGVLVTLGGGAAAVTVTDGSGKYEFTGLLPGSYTATPSYPGYAFTPAELTTTITTADVGGQDFVSVATRKISGRISGDVLAGVKVALTGDATADTTTDASGYFEFAGLVGGAYVVTPSLDGYAFGPADRAISLGTADVTGVSFTASGVTGYTVSGSVTLSGAALAGVTVTLAPDGGGPTAVATTDVAGAFRFQGVAPGQYELIPSHDDYTFTPASRFVIVSAANVTAQGFTAALSPNTRTVSGTITGVATAYVTVTLVGPTSKALKTDATGAFAFRALPDGVYLVTPSLAGFAFTPADCLVTVAGPSVTSLAFESTVAPVSLSISGRVSGAVAAGVSIALSGAATGGTVTAGDGTYAFTGLPNGAYKLTPALAGYVFSPVQAEVTLDGANVTRVDFASVVPHAISGHVSGDVVADVQIALSGAASFITTTDAAGYFAFPGLRDGGYVLTPSLAGYAFDPTSLPTDLAGADLTAANFTATLIPTYTASGTITGAVQDGVTLTLTGAAGSLTTTTAGGGLYAFPGLPDGSYMVIPSLAGYAFTPASRAFRIDRAAVTGQNFSAAFAP